MSNNASTEMVLVTYYVMLGDADGSIEGWRAMPKAEWDADVKTFEEALEKGVEPKGFGNGYEFEPSLEDYGVKALTPEEFEVLKKLFGNAQGRVEFGTFQFPTSNLPGDEYEPDEDE